MGHNRTPAARRRLGRKAYVRGVKLKSSLDAQVGGGHYKSMAIQPVEFVMKNNLNFLQGCIIKRICRYKSKGTPLEDLEKAKHEIDLLIELGGLKK